MAEARDPDDPSTAVDEEQTDPEVEQVKTDTEKVVRSFVYRRLTSHIDKEATEGDLDLASIPVNVINDLRGAREQFESDNKTGSDPSLKQIDELGKSLATFGDEIQEKYHDTFTQLISRLNLTSESELAFDAFTNIARKLFDNGINWYRIIALLCFGYEIAVAVIKQGVHGVGRFLKKIVNFVVNFIVKEKIVNWIAQQGGWVTALTDLPSMGADGLVRNGAMVAVVTIVVAVIYGVFRIYSSNSKS